MLARAGEHRGGERRTHERQAATGDYDYENPLARHPGRRNVDSCADPMIIQGQDGETIDGEQVWYLYGTTDPLNDEDVDANGDPVFHRIPMNVSTDLVNWTYVGDAFPLTAATSPTGSTRRRPSGHPRSSTPAPPTSTLFVTVTETTACGGGSDTCRGDSAIGVAVSDSPTGSGCGRAGSSSPAGPGQPRPCAPLLGPSTPMSSGTPSTTRDPLLRLYYGGIFATEVTFTETGVTAVTETTADDTCITIGNRYEGANVVYNEEEGYYYLFASATNCCNGALTGYSVCSSGRSTSPSGRSSTRRATPSSTTAARRSSR